MYLTIIKEIEKIENRCYRHINYLKEVKDTTHKERKIIELFNQEKDVKIIHDLLNNKTRKETNKEIKLMIRENYGVLEMGRVIKEYLKEIA